MGDQPPVRNEQWTPNFWAREFSSRGREFAKGTRSDYQALAVILQRVRDHIARPITIVSGQRLRDHNDAVGGAPDSRHLPPQERANGASGGVAADFRVAGYSTAELHRLYLWLDARASDLGIGGLEFYPKGGFIHVDTRPNRARWPEVSGRARYESGAA